MNQEHEQHFLRHVANLSSTSTITSHEDIVSDSGIKLIKLGTRITPDFYQRLLNHKLLKPIESSLQIDEGLKTKDLADKAHLQITNSPLLSAMIKNIDNGIDPLEIISSLKIPNQLFFKLSIAAQQLPSVFEHSLQVAVAAIYFAHKLNLDRGTIEDIAFAGLFHDMGLLHLDSGIFTSQQQINDEQRKQIYAHPAIAALILKEFPGYHKISQAILEHHERMDGSGYPHGLHESQIGIMGQILIISELAVSLSDKACKFSYQSSLQAILKFNAEQYPSNLVLILLQLLATIKQPDTASTLPFSRGSFMNTLSSIWLILNAWKNRSHQGLGVPQVIIDYTCNRVRRLEHNLNMAGLSLSDISMDDASFDEVLLNSEETQALLSEAQYQTYNIIHDVKRRWPELTIKEDTDTDVRRWLSSVETIFSNQHDLLAEFKLAGILEESDLAGKHDAVDDFQHDDEKAMPEDK